MVKKSLKKYRNLKNSILSWLSSRIYILLFIFLEKLSLKYASLFGRICGSFLFYLSKSRREVVGKNIITLREWARDSYKQYDYLDDERDLTKEIYKSNCSNFFYSISLMAKSPDILRKHLKIRNINLLKKIHEKHKGAIILFSHTGPWELIVKLPELISSIFDPSNFYVMYRPLNNYYLDKWYLKRRKRFGAKLLSRDDGFIKIIRFLKNGAYINLACDIRMNEGPKISLFGKEASTSKIPYVLYKAAKVPVIAMSFVRIDNLSWELKFEEIASSTNDLISEDNLLKTTNEHLEEIIHKRPCDYFFFQDRYK